MISRLRIKTQVRLVALGCVLLGICGTFLIAAYYEGRLYDSALERRARVMVDSFLTESVEPLLNYDVVRLDNLVEAIRRDEGQTYQDLKYAMVLDAEGRVVAHSHGYHLYGQLLDDLANVKALASQEPTLVQRLEDQVLDVSRPVVVGGKRWGTVRIGLDLQPFREQVNAAWLRTLAIVVVLALVLAGIAGAWLRPLFISPLDEVTRAAGAIGSRDFSYRIRHQRADEIGKLYDAMNRMAELLDDRERLHATFGRYVTDSVRDAILGGVTTRGIRVRAAILFADVRGFTARCEALPPEEVLALLNRFCGRMAAAVEAHGGIVDKFIGDSVMAVFGAPVPLESCALRAVRAAESMRLELRELNLELQAAGIEPLRMGVGVHVGECVAGSMGAPTRMQYTVVGDTVNVASRLQSLTKEFDTEVVLSEEVFAESGAHIRARCLGPVEIRGRQMRLTLYALEGVNEPPSRSEAQAARVTAA